MFGYVEVYANVIHLIYIGVYPHKYIGHEDNVQTGGVVRVICYFMRMCVITSYYCTEVVELETQFCTLWRYTVAAVWRTTEGIEAPKYLTISFTKDA